MELKYNEVLGEIVKPNDEPATQSEKFEWMLENPGKDDFAKSDNDPRINEVIESLTVKKTPDSTTVEEGVESITERA
jgi:hypothetical protein|tara:strand:+ start:109 stop:339 length:231 start_codon:yes stop_codon:yes gene_type:complete